MKNIRHYLYTEYIKKVKKIILYLLLSSTFCFQTVNSKEIKVFEFTEEELKNLKVHSFKKKTTYTLGSNENGNYLKAEYQM